MELHERFLHVDLGMRSKKEIEDVDRMANVRWPNIAWHYKPTGRKTRPSRHWKENESGTGIKLPNL
jgi:hypothetical protein